MVFIDDANVSNDEAEFSYRNNPSYESVSPMNTIPAYVSNAVYKQHTHLPHLTQWRCNPDLYWDGPGCCSEANVCLH